MRGDRDHNRSAGGPLAPLLSGTSLVCKTHSNLTCLSLQFTIDQVNLGRTHSNIVDLTQFKQLYVAPGVKESEIDKMLTYLHESGPYLFHYLQQ